MLLLMVTIITDIANMLLLMVTIMTDIYNNYGSTDGTSMLDMNNGLLFMASEKTYMDNRLLLIETTMTYMDNRLLLMETTMTDRDHRHLLVANVQKKDADQIAYRRNLITAFLICCPKFSIAKLASFKTTLS